jgi:hypothetical protein
MPNWCTNLLLLSTINDSDDADEQLSRFSALIHGDENFIETLIPTPTDYDEKIDLKKPQSEEVSSKMIELHGAADWYDWQQKNWGTKWGASETELFIGSNHNLIVKYNTPWAPANIALVTISKLFPLLAFQNFCSEPGWGIYGYIDIENGEILVDSEER